MGRTICLAGDAVVCRREEPHEDEAVGDGAV